MQKGILISILIFLSNQFATAQKKDFNPPPPKDVIVNGAIDSFGYFRFYSKSYLFENYSKAVKNQINGDFYFYKNVYDRVSKHSSIVIYKFSSYYSNSISDTMPVEEIQRAFLKNDSLSKNDLWKMGAIVNTSLYKRISLLKEGVFFKNYVSRYGVLINFKNEQEQIAVIFRLLKMNIPVIVLELSGDLAIPTHEIGGGNVSD